jgi:hypothetical protein
MLLFCRARGALWVVNEPREFRKSVERAREKEPQIHEVIPTPLPITVACEEEHGQLISGFEGLQALRADRTSQAQKAVRERWNR